MKITKEEALDLYVHHQLTDNLTAACRSASVHELMQRIKDWLTDEKETRSVRHVCLETQGVDEEEHVNVEDCEILDDDQTCLDQDVEDSDEDPEEGVEEEELPEADASVDPEDLHALPAVSATTETGSKSMVEFEELNSGPVDLVVEDTGEILQNISHVRRDAKSLSVYGDDGWRRFEVKKFQKAWTSLLLVGKVYAVER